MTQLRKKYTGSAAKGVIKAAAKYSDAVDAVARREFGVN